MINVKVQQTFEVRLLRWHVRMLNFTPGIMCVPLLVDAGGTLTNSSTHHTSVHCGARPVPPPKRPPSVFLRELISFTFGTLSVPTVCLCSKQTSTCNPSERHREETTPVMKHFIIITAKWKYHSLPLYSSVSIWVFIFWVFKVNIITLLFQIKCVEIPFNYRWITPLVMDLIMKCYLTWHI